MFAERPRLRLINTFFVALAACAPTANGSDGIRAATITSPASSDKVILAQSVGQIFSQTCYRCHGERARGGFAFVTDLDRLRNSPDYINLQNPEKSLIYEKIRLREMPPEGEQPQLNADQVATVLAWIQAGAPNQNGSTSSESTTDGESEEQVQSAIATDLAQQPPEARKNLRYLTLSYIARAGASEAELSRFANGVAKLVNSLSFESETHKPVAIAKKGHILRIDISKLGWNPENRNGDDIWERLGSQSPYSIPKTKSYPELVERIGSRYPYLRADWFASTASRRDTYYSFLRIRADGTDTELERRLGVDINSNIALGGAFRAGFLKSKVSLNNRMIERHTTSYGAYWKSYDFVESEGFSDIFTRPLGPGQRASEFIHTAGEIIFSLPNGMQGYALAKANHQLQTEAPINVVQDSSRPEAQIFNAISCMSCHSQGMKPAQDEIRNFALSNAEIFSRTDLESILRLYRGNSELQSWLAQDSKRFTDALNKAGVSASGDQEPIRFLTDRYDHSVDLKVALAELDTTEAALKVAARDKPSLESLISRLRSIGLSRNSFSDSYPQLYEALYGQRPEYSSPSVDRTSPQPPTDPFTSFPTTPCDHDIRTEVLDRVNAGSRCKAGEPLTYHAGRPSYFTGTYVRTETSIERVLYRRISCQTGRTSISVVMEPVETQTNFRMKNPDNSNSIVATTFTDAEAQIELNRVKLECEGTLTRSPRE